MKPSVLRGWASRFRFSCCPAPAACSYGLRTLTHKGKKTPFWVRNTQPMGLNEPIPLFFGGQFHRLAPSGRKTPPHKGKKRLFGVRTSVLRSRTSRVPLFYITLPFRRLCGSFVLLCSCFVRMLEMLLRLQYPLLLRISQAE